MYHTVARLTFCSQNIFICKKRYESYLLHTNNTTLSYEIIETTVHSLDYTNKSWQILE